MTPMWEFRTRQDSIELVTLVLMGEAGFSILDAYVLNKGDVDYIYSTGVQSEGEREKWSYNFLETNHPERSFNCLLMFSTCARCLIQFNSHEQCLANVMFSSYDR